MEKVALTRIMEKMKLNNFTPEINVDGIMVTHADVNRPALQLAGFFDHFDTERLQLIGNVEYAYMETLENEEEAERVYRNLFSRKIPCLIFCRGLVPCDLLLKIAKEYESEHINPKNQIVKVRLYTILDIFAIFDTTARTNIEVYSNIFDATEEEVEKMLGVEYPIEEEL